MINLPRSYDTWQCQNCVFFDLYDHMHAGSCVRYPPERRETDLIASWPRVLKFSKCGEFQLNDYQEGAS